MGRDVNDTNNTKVCDITAGCFHQRRNETWDINIDTERGLLFVVYIPLYPAMMDDGRSITTALYSQEGYAYGRYKERGPHREGSAPDRSMAWAF